MKNNLENMTSEQLKKHVLDLQKQNQVIRATLSSHYTQIEERCRQIESSYTKLEAENKRILQENALMAFQIDQMKRLLYGSKRERFISNQQVNQMVLPFEVEEITCKEPEVVKIQEHSRHRKTKPHPGRNKLPSHLPVKEVVIEPDHNTSGLKFIGREITEKLDFVPAKLSVIHYIRNKYVDPNTQDNPAIIIGDLPSFPIEKGIATAGLLSGIAVDKYVDHLPLYRQVERFKRERIPIAPSTIDSWIIQMATLVTPLYEHIKHKILKQGYLQVDETPIKVLDKGKKGKTHQGYYWVYHSPLQNAVFFDYRPGRGRDGPRQLLKDFTGYLQTDGYNVYEWFGRQDGITLLGCMSHARRKFELALDYDREKASEIMTLIQGLYLVERKARDSDLDAAARKELRLNKALPIANKLGKRIASLYKTQIPKSPLGMALAYTISRWDNLLNYLYDGSLEIDNNLVENAIRPNALGRKNFLFAGSHEGAKRSAIFYTFFGTCKMHGVNPWQWLKKVLEVIPDHHVNKLDELLPQNLKL